MAVTAAQVVVKVGADVSGLKTGLSEAENTAKQKASSIRGILGNIMGTAGGVLAGFGLNAGIGGVGSLISYIFGSDEQLQNYQTAFTRLLGSSKAAQQEIANLQQFAAKTPLTFPDVAQATQALLGYGFQLKQTQPLITAIGDALAATGHLDPATLQQVVMVFGQMHASVHLQTQDLRQLQSVGINAFELLAESLKPTKTQFDDLVKKGLIPAGDAQEYLSGKTKLTQADIQQLVTDGLIPSKDGINDMTNAIENNPIYQGGMAAQSQTTAGKLSTLKDNVQQALETMSKPIFDKFGNVIAKIGDAVGSPQFKQFAKTVGTDIANAITTTTQDVKDIVGWFIQWHEPIIDVGTAITVFFLPAIIKSGVESTIAGGKIAANWVMNVIKSGQEAVVAAGKIWISAASFVYGIIKSGVEAGIAGGRIAVNWIKNVVTGGEAAEASAVQADALATSEEAAGTSAATAAPEVEALAVAEEAEGTNAATAAPELEGLATAEGAVGDAATGAAGAAGTAGAAGLGVVGLLAAIVGMGDYLTMKAPSDWLTGKIVDWLNDITGATNEAGRGFFNFTQMLIDAQNATKDGIKTADILMGLHSIGEAAVVDAIDLQQAINALRHLDNMPPPPGYHPGGGQHFASGGIMPYSGVALVGERGPEPVFLPQGSRTISHEDAMRALSGGRGGGDTYIFQGITDDQALTQRLRQISQRNQALYGRR